MTWELISDIHRWRQEYWHVTAVVDTAIMVICPPTSILFTINGIGNQAYTMSTQTKKVSGSQWIGFGFGVAIGAGSIPAFQSLNHTVCPRVAGKVPQWLVSSADRHKTVRDIATGSISKMTTIAERSALQSAAKQWGPESSADGIKTGTALGSSIQLAHHCYESHLHDQSADLNAQNEDRARSTAGDKKIETLEHSSSGGDHHDTGCGKSCHQPCHPHSDDHSHFNDHHHSDHSKDTSEHTKESTGNSEECHCGPNCQPATAEHHEVQVTGLQDSSHTQQEHMHAECDDYDELRSEGVQETNIEPSAVDPEAFASQSEAAIPSEYGVLHQGLSAKYKNADHWTDPSQPPEIEINTVDPPSPDPFDPYDSQAQPSNSTASPHGQSSSDLPIPSDVPSVRCSSIYDYHTIDPLELGNDFAADFFERLGQASEQSQQQDQRSTGQTAELRQQQDQIRSLRRGATDRCRARRRRLQDAICSWYGAWRDGEAREGNDGILFCAGIAYARQLKRGQLSTNKVIKLILIRAETICIRTKMKKTNKAKDQLEMAEVALKRLLNAKKSSRIIMRLLQQDR